MGKRDMTQYICDGCGELTNCRPDEKPTNFRTIAYMGRDRWLCGACHGAVEWVVQFQRITHPPRVFRNSEGRYSLRKPS